MNHLNLNHLHYFWIVARSGSIAKACEQLLVTQPTISIQLRDLERSIGHKLFRKNGRGQELSEMGQVVFRYADEMFSLSRELVETVKGVSSQGRLSFAVGVVNALPKLVTFRLIEPALKLPEKVRVICRHDSLELLLEGLAIHSVDLILSDSPMSSATKLPGYNHLLGESLVSILAARPLARKYRTDFPHSLDGAPFLMPARHSSLRRDLTQWFERRGIRPQVDAEVDDSALVKVLGQAGQGLFAVPTIIEKDACSQFEVELVGRLEGLSEKFYAITAERRLQHPAVMAVTSGARNGLFKRVT